MNQSNSVAPATRCCGLIVAVALAILCTNASLFASSVT